MSRAVSRPLLAFVLSLSAVGCAAQDTELKERVKSIQARREAESMGGDDVRLEIGLAGGGTTWCPSSEKPAQVQVTVQTGPRTMRTPVLGAPAGEDTMPYSAVTVTTSAGSLSPEWTLLAPPVALSMIGKPITIEATLNRKPSVRAQQQLTPSSDCNQIAEFRGRPGRPGPRGEDGEKGLSVVVGVVYVTLKSGERLVMAKAVPSAGTTAYFALTPGRKLGIDVRGGEGGTGGHLGGDGGNGGQVEVHYDQSFPELRDVVLVANTGGKGGYGGGGPYGPPSYAGRVGRSGPAPRYVAGDVVKIFQEEIDQGLKITRAP